MKAALFVPRQVRETLQTSYYLPARTLAEKAETLVDFSSKEEEVEKFMVGIYKKQTNQRKEIVRKKFSHGVLDK